MPLWSERLGRWVPNSECDASGEPYAVRRKDGWTLVAERCLEQGHLKWANEAFEYALADDPPVNWPPDHPACRRPITEAKWYMRLIGRVLLKGVTFRND